MVQSLFTQAVAPLTPALQISNAIDIHLSWPSESSSSVFKDKKKNDVEGNAGDREGPRQLASRPVKPTGWASFMPPIICDWRVKWICTRSSSALVPTPFVLGDNRMEPTPTPYQVHCLEGYKSLCHFYTEDMSLSQQADILYHLNRLRSICAKRPDKEYCPQEFLFYRSLRLKSSGCRIKERNIEFRTLKVNDDKPQSFESRLKKEMIPKLASHHPNSHTTAAGGLPNSTDS
ncbi:hypothetical protein TNCV_4669321 [Trichonephila clavipes]|nr:hypothetical protein TNCV_4669321 [Trichonephila clavipes]